MKPSRPHHPATRHAATTRVHRALTCVALLALIASSGCGGGTTTTRPAATGEVMARTDAGPAGLRANGPDRMPLAIGNRWVYERHYRLSVKPVGLPPRTVFEISGSITLSLGCLDTTENAVYAFERAVEVQRIANMVNTSVSWRDLREDRLGLYEIVPSRDQVPHCPDLPLTPGAGAPLLADPDRMVATAMTSLPATLDTDDRTRAFALIGALARRSAELERPRRAPGAQSGELMRLVYPLVPGRDWSYVDPSVPSTVACVVTGREACTVPAGTWKASHIAQTWVGSSAPGDTIEAWYGPVGMLRYRYRLVAGDPGRTRYITENEQRLVQVTLTDERGHSATR